ncbi:MAG: single-stranded DNA-binding protein [Candidatus Nanopelagicales bacterium]
MNETTVTVSGNLVSDVAYRVTERGDPMATFRVASTVKRFDRTSGRWADGETAYWAVTAWRRAAENARESLAKGHPVVVYGRLRQRVVDRELPGGSGARLPVTYTDIDAFSFGLDLSRCRARYERAPIGPQTTVSDPWSADQSQVAGEGAAAAGSATKSESPMDREASAA